MTCLAPATASTDPIKTHDAVRTLTSTTLPSLDLPKPHPDRDVPALQQDVLKAAVVQRVASLTPRIGDGG